MNLTEAPKELGIEVQNFPFNCPLLEWEVGVVVTPGPWGLRCLVSVRECHLISWCSAHFYQFLCAHPYTGQREPFSGLAAPFHLLYWLGAHLPSWPSSVLACLGQPFLRSLVPEWESVLKPGPGCFDLGFITLKPFSGKRWGAPFIRGFILVSNPDSGFKHFLCVSLTQEAVALGELYALACLTYSLRHAHSEPRC